MSKLKNCEFTGLPGIQDLKIDLSEITTFTGPNGTGKSTVLKVIDLALRILEEREVCNNLPQHEPWHLFVTASLYFECKTPLKTNLLDEIKSFTIFIECDEKNYCISKISDNNLSLSIDKPVPRIDIENWKEKINKAKNQLIHLENEIKSSPSHSQHLVHQQQKQARATAEEKINENSYLIEDNKEILVMFEGNDIEKVSAVPRSELITLLNELNIPTVRHITTQQLMEQDISLLIDRLVTLKKGNKIAAKNFKIIEDRLNRILQSEIDVSEAKDGNKTLLIHGMPYKKASTGTFLTLSFFSLTESEDSNKIVLWDEPENGLHPTRRIQLLDLMRVDGRQFIIATHATEFAPVLQNDSKVYRCINNYDESTSEFKFSVASVATRRDAFTTLEALGIHPARTLFTANVVIWIEGPTELLFYRHWLTLRLEKKGYQEGLHYSFMQYGGSLINYLEVADIGVFESTIDLLSHCRHPVVLVDSDVKEAPLSIQEQVLKPGAKRISDEIRRLNMERKDAAMFQATRGREIENYLPKNSIWHAIEKLWSEFSDIKEKLPLEKIDLGQYKKYPETIEEFFLNEGIVDSKNKPRGRSIWGSANKVSMMSAALSMPEFEEHNLELKCSETLDEIEKFIKSKHEVEYSNGLNL